jgi:glycerophosphoryl diester phosphodiesterase
MNLFRESHPPFIVAHRGASTYAPENTLAAFRMAAEQGADSIELDAKLSADGQIVVIHDQTLERTTNGSGKVISQTLAELKAWDAGSFFSDQFKGEPIPTLEEVFEAVAGRLLINVELTNYSSPADGLVEKVCGLVKKLALEERVLFSSFLPTNLQTAQRILPEVPVAILAMPGWRGWLARSLPFLRTSPEWVHPYFEDASASYITNQHRFSRKVNVWTVDDPVEMVALLKDGVDGLITDDPIAARQALASVLESK